MFVCIDGIIESILKYFSELTLHAVCIERPGFMSVHVSSFPWLISLECAASSARNNAYNSFFYRTSNGNFVVVFMEYP